MSKKKIFLLCIVASTLVIIAGCFLLVSKEKHRMELNKTQENSVVLERISRDRVNEIASYHNSRSKKGDIN